MVKRKYRSKKTIKHSKKRKKSSQKRTKRSKKMIKRSNRRSAGRLNRNNKIIRKQKSGGVNSTAAAPSLRRKLKEIILDHPITKRYSQLLLRTRELRHRQDIEGQQDIRSSPKLAQNLLDLYFSNDGFIKKFIKQIFDSIDSIVNKSDDTDIWSGEAFKSIDVFVPSEDLENSLFAPDSLYTKDFNYSRRTDGKLPIHQSSGLTKEIYKAMQAEIKNDSKLIDELRDKDKQIGDIIKMLRIERYPSPPSRLYANHTSGAHEDERWENRKHQYEDILSKLKNDQRDMEYRINEGVEMIDQLKSGNFEGDAGARIREDLEDYMDLEIEGGIPSSAWISPWDLEIEMDSQKLWGSLKKLESRKNNIEKIIKNKNDQEKKIQDINTELQSIRTKRGTELGNRTGRNIFNKKYEKLVADKMRAENELENITKDLTEDTDWDDIRDRDVLRLGRNSKMFQFRVFRRALVARYEMIIDLNTTIKDLKEYINTIKNKIVEINRMVEAKIPLPPLPGIIEAENAEENRLAAIKAVTERRKDAIQEENNVVDDIIKSNIAAKNKKEKNNKFKCVAGNCVQDENGPFMNEKICKLSCGRELEPFTPYKPRSEKELKIIDAERAERIRNAKKAEAENRKFAIEIEKEYEEGLQKRLRELAKEQLDRKRNDKIADKQRSREIAYVRELNDQNAERAERIRNAAKKAEEERRINSSKEEIRDIDNRIEKAKQERIKAEQEKIAAEKAEKEKIAAVKEEQGRIDLNEKYEMYKKMQEEQKRTREVAEKSLATAWKSSQEKDDANEQKRIAEETANDAARTQEINEQMEKRQLARLSAQKNPLSERTHENSHVSVSLQNVTGNYDPINEPSKWDRLSEPPKTQSNGGGKNKLKKNSRKKKKYTKPHKSKKNKLQKRKSRKSIKKKKSTKSRKRKPSKSTKKKSQKRKSYK